MRRPVKPFVTEYKGPVRRQSGLSGLSLKSEDDLDPQPIWPSAEPRLGMVSPPEDGYEAALRAADALFSGAPIPTRDPSPVTTDRIAAAMNGAPGGGRILQAIVETSPVALAVPDEGPKRRGRKPGSKNKPKVVDPDAAPVPTARRPLGPVRAPAFASAFTDGLAPSSAAQPDGSRGFAPVPALTTGSPPPRAPSVKIVAPVKTEQFPWVRTKLKPGENWKRRLPKVIW